MAGDRVYLKYYVFIQNIGTSSMNIEYNYLTYCNHFTLVKLELYHYFVLN